MIYNVLEFLPIKSFRDIDVNMSFWLGGIISWYLFVEGWLLFYHFSIHNLSYDIFIFVLSINFRRVTILPFTLILVSISDSARSLTLFLSLLLTYYMLCLIRVSHKTNPIWSPILRITFINQVILFFPKSFPHETIGIFWTIMSSTFVIIYNHRRRKKKGWQNDEWLFHLVSYNLFRTNPLNNVNGLFLQEKGSFVETFWFFEVFSIGYLDDIDGSLF